MSVETVKIKSVSEGKPMSAEKIRFVVRDATGVAWDWLPNWVVVDTEKQVRVAAYDDEETARKDAMERNQVDD